MQHVLWGFAGGQLPYSLCVMNFEELWSRVHVTVDIDIQYIQYVVQCGFVVMMEDGIIQWRLGIYDMVKSVHPLFWKFCGRGGLQSHTIISHSLFLCVHIFWIRKKMESSMSASIESVCWIKSQSKVSCPSCHLIPLPSPISSRLPYPSPIPHSLTYCRYSDIQLLIFMSDATAFLTESPVIIGFHSIPFARKMCENQWVKLVQLTNLCQCAAKTGFHMLITSDYQ